MIKELAHCPLRIPALPSGQHLIALQRDRLCCWRWNSSGDSYRSETYPGKGNNYELDAIFTQEIRLSVMRGEKSWENICRLREDGSSKGKEDEALETKRGLNPPLFDRLNPHAVSLRETHGNLNTCPCESRPKSAISPKEGRSFRWTQSVLSRTSI